MQTRIICAQYGAHAARAEVPEYLVWPKKLTALRNHVTLADLLNVIPRQPDRPSKAD